MRSAVVSDWLAASEWSGWSRLKVAGDASARQYERLINAKAHSVILMDAPPDICGSQDSFVNIARHLRDLGLCAPDIYAFDGSLGLLVLEDLGKGDFAAHLRTTPNDERDLYEAAVDVLLALGSAPPPTGLRTMTPEVGTSMIDLAFDWAAQDKSKDLQNDISSRLNALLKAVSPAPNTLSLRDFHAENLIWRPDHGGTDRVGLLDFQDAFITHPAYDLASLLRDARRNVDPSLTPILLDRLGGGEDLTVAFHVMAVQRNLRILGIFHKLATQDGKPKYLDFLPRVRQHLRSDLAQPCLQDIAPLITRAFNLGEDSQ